MAISDVHRDVTNTHAVVTSTHMIVSDIHRTMAMNQGGCGGKDLSVSVIHTPFIAESMLTIS